MRWATSIGTDRHCGTANLCNSKRIALLNASPLSVLSSDFETCGTESVGSYSEDEPAESEDLLRKGFRTRKCDRTECVDDCDFLRVGWDENVTPTSLFIEGG